jgi:hypothetical protein
MMCPMNAPPETESPPPHLLTVKEAAPILRLSASTVYRWSCTGVNPQLFVRVRGGGRGLRPGLRIHAERLAAFIAAGTPDE